MRVKLFQWNFKILLPGKITGKDIAEVFDVRELGVVYGTKPA